MTVPDYQSLMLPVLSTATQEEVRFKDVVDRLANQLQITPEDRGELLASGKQTVFTSIARE